MFTVTCSFRCCYPELVVKEEEDQKNLWGSHTLQPPLWSCQTDQLCWGPVGQTSIILASFPGHSRPQFYEHLQYAKIEGGDLGELCV